MDIGVWGDSITYGANDETGLGWVGRFRNIHTLQNGDSQVYDRGICGDTSRGVLKRFDRECSSFIYPLDAVIFAIGINDTVERSDANEREVPVDEFERNITELIQVAKARVAHVYIIGLTNIDEKYTVPLPESSTAKCYHNNVIKEYNDALEQVAIKHNVPFVNLFGLLDNSDLADGLHPNAQGYAKMAVIIAQQINNLYQG